jgi:acid stress chaperone HdeB
MRASNPAGDKVMIKFVGVVSALIFALHAVPAARAQVMLDVSKITCEQFAGYKITTPQNVAIWLSGYYNGKRGNTVIDMQKLLADTKTMERYCIQNPQTLVMNAVETVLGVK